MILHHYIWGDIDIDIVEEVAPHFLIAKHYGNLCIPDKIQPKYLYEVPFTVA